MLALVWSEPIKPALQTRLQQNVAAHSPGAMRSGVASTAGGASSISGMADNYLRSDHGGARGNKQVGGTFFHSVKGARNAPRGERLAGAVEAVKANARRLGGSFAVWGGLFSTFDCCLIAIRNKEDPYNSIVCRPPWQTCSPCRA